MVLKEWSAPGVKNAKLHHLGQLQWGHRDSGFQSKTKLVHESEISALIFIVRNYQNEKEIMFILFTFF